MHPLRRHAVLLPTLLLSSLSSLFGLGVGDPAPPMQVEAMVKGRAVDLSRGVHVVEFWSLGCGPCLESIPHLTELAKTYQGKVDFTGVDSGGDELGRVQRFVAAKGEKMDYHVAWDGDARVTYKRFMEAAHQDGIPCAFLVKEGVIYWIGHPLEGLDAALDRLLAGKLDLVTAKAEAEQGTAKEAAWEAAIQPVEAAQQARDYPAMLAAIDKEEAAHPENKERLLSKRFIALVETDNPEVKAVAQSFLASGEGVYGLSGRAQIIFHHQQEENVSKPAANEAALLLAERAAQLSEMKEFYPVAAYATALFKMGDKRKALEVQTRALELARTDPVGAEYVKRMEDRLEEYRKAND